MDFNVEEYIAKRQAFMDINMGINSPFITKWIGMRPDTNSNYTMQDMYDEIINTFAKANPLPIEWECLK